MTHSVGRSRTASISDAVWETANGSGSAPPSRKARVNVWFRSPKLRKIISTDLWRYHRPCREHWSSMHLLALHIQDHCQSYAMADGELHKPVASSKYVGTTGCPHSAWLAAFALFTAGRSLFRIQATCRFAYLLVPSFICSTASRNAASDGSGALR